MSHFHSKYFAHSLSLLQPSRWTKRLSTSLLNATIDLNPHQVDGALFFFDNPLTKGIILADEVWLWKTIEAWLVLCQLRSEMKRKILLVVPASLRKQRVAELQEKFHLPAIIIDWPLYRSRIDNWEDNPFDQEAIIITSYSFASSEDKDLYKIWSHIEEIDRDLVVFDEAHKLRNIYRDLESDLDEFFDKPELDKPKRRSTAKKLYDRFEHTKKLLLTATPLQNSLMELFGLMNFVDPYSFWDIDSFKEQYNPQTITDKDIALLKKRIEPYFHRTLRKQVASDIKYTARKPLTQEFIWSEQEALFYEAMSEFLRTNSLFQNKNWQVNYLIVLVYWKLLASSIPAILWTLHGLSKRISKEIEEIKSSHKRSSQKTTLIDSDIFDQDVVDLYTEQADDKDIDLQDDVSDAVDQESILQLEDNLKQLYHIIDLAQKVETDSKAQALLKSIWIAYEQLSQLWARRKILIFTESRRTQDYLFSFLNSQWFDWKVVCFNGDNNSPMVKKIYNTWKQEYENTSYFSGSVSSDTRASIVDFFKNHAEIMIATESAAEWINLQFCSLIINYDLPWNPQRIEQRIGRCHRYGQEFDVIVMNLINTQNRADERVFELLSQKFTLFQWLFWASDTVLWALESWIDVEKTIWQVYQTCRTKEEIDKAFDDLQQQMEDAVTAKQDDAKEKVLNRFDEDVARRLKDKKEESELILNVMQQRLMKLVAIEAQPNVEVLSDHALRIYGQHPIWITPGIYSFDLKRTAWYLLRTSDPLWKYCIDTAKNRQLPTSKIVFNLSGHLTNISALQKYKGQKWILRVSKLTINAYATEEYLVHTWLSYSWDTLNEEIVEKFFLLDPIRIDQSVHINSHLVDSLIATENKIIWWIHDNSREANEQYFTMEMDKLDHRSDDLKISLQKQRKSIKAEIQFLRKEYRSLQQLEEKVATQRKIRSLEQKESKIRREIDELEDQIDAKKEVLIDEIQKRLEANSTHQELFTIERELS